jgi:hypothetical protein
LQVSSARDGFDVQVTRLVTPGEGGEPRSLRIATSYQPARTLTLIGVG